MSTGGAVNARRELLRLCHLGLYWTEFATRANQVLQEVVPHERVCWHTIDPATLLMTGAVVENLPPDGFPVLVRCEYETNDVNTWSFLARSPWPVGILSRATHGQAQQSRRYRELLAPTGIEVELRASLVSEGACWGALGLFRGPGAPDFTDAEAAFVASVVSSLGQGLRRSLLVGDPLFDEIPDGPGVVILDDDDQVVSTSEPARRWLAELDDIGARLPPVIWALAARARALSRGGGPGEPPAWARVRSRRGVWMVLHATTLIGEHQGRTAVIVELARPAELAPLIVHAYGLTPREREVTRLTVQGLSAKQAAHQLQVSTYTLQDHLRAIYDKVGVHSRQELVARVFFDHYWPRMHDGSVLAADGWFSTHRGGGDVPDAKEAERPIHP